MQISSGDTYSSSGTVNSYTPNYQDLNPQLSADALVLNATFDDSSSSTDVNFEDLYKSLTITSKQIVDKLNDILKNKLPNGLQSLKPEEVTPETSSDNVVKGVTALFAAFAKQNAELSPEDLVAKFIEEAKKGVEQGYGDATETLKSLGALEIDGVQDGISKTKDLILEKLDKFAELKLQELNGTTARAADITKETILKQAGGLVLDLAA